jgi:septal ring factor EnvC (AmiA/AmiB activator)
MNSPDITSKQYRPQQLIKSEGKQAKVDLVARLQEQDDKYLKRLEANKKSAQASRERKKQLKDELEKKVLDITAENRRMATEITQLETENKVLKGEFIQLQKIIADSPVLSKLMDRATSVQLALSDKERMMKAEEIPSSSSTSSPNSNTAAFMYLMIVLQSFGQHFAALGQTPNFDFMNLRPPVEVM